MPLLKGQMESALLTTSRLLGKEEFESPQKLTQRFVLHWQNSIVRLDWSIYTYDQWLQQAPKDKMQKVLYQNLITRPQRRKHLKWKADAVPQDLAHQNKIWFLLFECEKKFMRNDNLIGLHLLLELIQEYLVLRMQERDEAAGTTIHRYGQSETLPVALDMDKLDYCDKPAISTYLRHLATAFEQFWQKQLDDFESRLHFFEEYLRKSQEQLES